MKLLFAKIEELEQENEMLRMKNKQIMESAAREKRESERLLKKAKVYFNNSNLSYVVLDSTQHIVNVNESFSQLFGYTKEEILSSPFSILFATPKLYHSWWKDYIDFDQLESVRNLSCKLQRKNKFIFWAELSGKKFEDEDETLSIWSIHDISIRIHSRDTIQNLNLKLQKQFEELSVILDIIPIPICTKNDTFHFTNCNKAFCSFLGVTKETILGQMVHDFFPTEVAQKFQEKDEQMSKTLSQTYKIAFHSELSHQDMVLEIHQKKVMLEELSGFIEVLIDVTQQEKQEQKLQQRIKEEVKKNLSIQVLHQEEMIRNAKFASIGQMAAGITHEINTPLTHVKGNFEMLIEDLMSLPPFTKKDYMLENTEIIKENLERIEAIIETMRGASQKSREVHNAINICDTILSALALSQNRAKQVVAITLSSIPFYRGGDERLLKDFVCSLQRQRIEQVWIIILNNALDELVKIEHFEDRSLYIDVFEKEEKVVVRFCDNAGGIDPKILPRIFEPFESTKESSGIGIGLNIAKDIVIQNNGEIIAYNDAKGAIFEVSFPYISLSKGINNAL